MSPKILQGTIDELKSQLEDKNAPFGIDLALPQVGGNARKTNVCHITLETLTILNFHWNVQYDYTNGQLSELVDIIIASKAKLFVSAIGVPPKEMIERLHRAGIVVMKYVLVVAILLQIIR